MPSNSSVLFLPQKLGVALAALWWAFEAALNVSSPPINKIFDGLGWHRRGREFRQFLYYNSSDTPVGNWAFARHKGPQGKRDDGQFLGHVCFFRCFLFASFSFVSNRMRKVGWWLNITSVWDHEESDSRAKLTPVRRQSYSRSLSVQWYQATKHPFRNGKTTLKAGRPLINLSTVCHSLLASTIVFLCSFHLSLESPVQFAAFSWLEIDRVVYTRGLAKLDTRSGSRVGERFATIRSFA